MKIQLQKTLLGRTLRRLAGEEKGAVMMEYVVLGVLLVAGVVAVVLVFGHRISDSFITMGHATGGEVQKAAEDAEAARNRVDAGIEAAKENQNQIVTEDIQ